jgi:hypothetical protein
MLKIFAIVALLIVLIVGYIVWQLIAVNTRARLRDQKLVARLDPIGKKIEAGEAVSPQEIDALAVHPEIRHMLFAALRNMNRPDLLPTNYSSSVSQGESAFAYWCMHPNELGDPPQAIELVETVKRTIDGQELDFHVYRYKMPSAHPDAAAGWLLGVVGPMRLGPEPYSEMPGAFSRGGDKEGNLKPSDLVDWYIGMLRQKRIL